MQTVQSAQAGNSRLRFVFNDSVRSFNLGAGTTLGEIAQTYGDLSQGGHGNPLTVDVTVSRCGGPFRGSFGQVE